MKIDPLEQSAYFYKLRKAYGEDIVTDVAFLNTAVQQEFEQLRHGINAGMTPKYKASSLSPERLLFMPLQKCTFKCRHCWVFGSPDSDCVLSEDQIRRIRLNLGKMPQLTVSGGEFFLHPFFRDILSGFPVQCIYTNGFWGYPGSRCSLIMEDVKAAVETNPQIDTSRLTMILSYDSYHAENFSSPAEEALSSIIFAAYEIFPEMNLRISHITDHPASLDIEPIVCALKALGFAVLHEENVTSNGNIRTVSYKYRKNGMQEKRLFADFFPQTLIGRAVLWESDPFCVKWWENMPLSRHQFTVGADGGVGVYEILHAPPVPYRAGNLIEEPWGQIMDTVRRDPIAAALQESGLFYFWEYLDMYNKALKERLMQNTQSVQQFMYLLLLEPERRLHLNRFLSDRT